MLLAPAHSFHVICFARFQGVAHKAAFGSSAGAIHEIVPTSSAVATSPMSSDGSDSIWQHV